MEQNICRVEKTIAFPVAVAGDASLDGPTRNYKNDCRVNKINGLKANYTFSFSNIQRELKDGGHIWSAAEELAKINTALLYNSLKRLALSKILLKRVLL